MDTDRTILRLGTGVILFALLLQLFGGRLRWKPEREDLIRGLVFLQTGRVAEKAEPLPTSPAQPSTEAPTAPPETTPPKAVLTGADAAAVAIHNQTGYRVDVEKLMEQNLNWQLRGEEPTVLILHTHGTESYRNTEGYQESTKYRTEDENFNMISVGDRLTALLEAGGIRVIHDRKPYDLPSYSGSYGQARTAIEKVLEEYPSVLLILDLHRDAMTDAAGNQMAYTKGEAAKLMVVSGSDAGGLNYPGWEKNLSLAVKLQALLEREEAGICRPLSFRTGRYNQDLFPNMLLIEVGAAGNTRGEALLAMETLAAGILEMASGTEYAQ